MHWLRDTLSRLRQQRRRRILSEGGRASRLSLTAAELAATLTGDTQQPDAVYLTRTAPRSSPSLTSSSVTSSPSDVTPGSRYATGSEVYM